MFPQNVQTSDTEGDLRSGGLYCHIFNYSDNWGAWVFICMMYLLKCINIFAVMLKSRRTALLGRIFKDGGVDEQIFYLMWASHINTWRL